MSIGFERAKKTFLGFLQAREKALNTIKNYACDLTELGQFCESKGLDFQKLGLKELEAYHEALKSKGLRPNSRRRKIMTAKTFLRYLSGRMDVSTVGSEKLIVPEKVEKPPRLVPQETVLSIARAQPVTGIGARNKALIFVLLETGMLVTEALNLRADDVFFHEDGSGATVTVEGKRRRIARLSKEASEALKELHARWLPTGAKWFFYGYSKAGPNAERMTSRGIEILFKGWAKDRGIEQLHPRTLRHLFVVSELLKDRSEREIMDALGLRTPYAFRVYRPLLDEIRNGALALPATTGATNPTKDNDDTDQESKDVRP